MLVKDFGFNHISTGNLLRSEIQNNTELGKKVKAVMDSGNLVPDQIVIDVLLSQLQAGKSYLFDGFPRTIEQAKILVKSVPIHTVAVLDIPHETIIQRLASRWIHLPSGRTYAYDFNPPKKLGFDDATGEPLTQRDDDKPEFVKRRLEDYQRVTSPVVEYFSQLQSLKFASFKGTESKVIYKSLQPFIAEAIQAK